MSPPLAVVEAAESFWKAAGVAGTYPRDIRRAVARVHPITIVMPSALHIASAEEWLRRMDLPLDIGEQNRPLRACLVAQSGHGFIFVDGNDPEDEQRFSIAHELAHFLRDYLAPRRAAVASHGEAILDVFDGLRPARPAERAIAVLSGSPVYRHVHLMGRKEDDVRLHAVDHAERMADALAIELLAPWDIVVGQIDTAELTWDRPAVASLLREAFGLPAAIAGRYASDLCLDAAPRSPLLQHLRRVKSAHAVQGESQQRPETS